jgi:hypothetical protein
MNNYLSINEKINFLNQKIKLLLIEIEDYEKIIADPSIASKDKDISNEVLLYEINEYLTNLKIKKNLYFSLIDNLKQ